MDKAQGKQCKGCVCIKCTKSSKLHVQATHSVIIFVFQVPPLVMYPSRSNLVVNNLDSVNKILVITTYRTNCEITTLYAGFEGICCYPCVEN